jgi:ketosteroid isomerase-like protein
LTDLREDSMTSTVRGVFERGTDRFNAHDLDGFAQVLADDVVFRAPGGMSGHGKAACAEFFGSWFSAFSDAHVEVHAVHFLDDIAVEEGTFTGTHDGVLPTPGGAIPPTGRSVEVAYTQVLRFRDGKHVSFNLMFDRLQMLEQLGQVPAPAPAS